MRKILALIVVATLSGSVSASGPSDVANAAQLKDATAVRKLIKEGADVNGAQGDGMTALHWAALNGDAELASMLLYAGANVGAKTRIGGYTPLHLAAQVGTRERDCAARVRGGVRQLPRRPPAPRALMQAAHSGSTDAVRILIENGADPNAQGNRERPDGADVCRRLRSRRRGQAVDRARRRSRT